MAMRMQELSERSGLPRTTIHHYLRESLLPPGVKTARNAAEYGERHLERLRLVTHLRNRSPGGGPGLSIPEIREVVRYVEAGARPGAATRLVRAEARVPPVPPGGAWSSIDELAAAGGVEATLARQIAAAGLLDPTGEFHAPSDLLVLRAAAEVCDGYAVDAEDLAPLGDLIRELGNYAATLEDLHAARASRPAGEGDAPSPLALALRELGEALLWRAMAKS